MGLACKKGNWVVALIEVSWEWNSDFWGLKTGCMSRWRRKENGCDAEKKGFLKGLWAFESGCFCRNGEEEKRLIILCNIHNNVI